MKLIRVNSLPKGSKKDGAPMRMEDHGGAVVQSYRKGDELYEQVTKDNGTVAIYKLTD